MKRRDRPQTQRPASARLVPLLAVSLTFGLRLWAVLSLQQYPFSRPSPQVVDSWYYHTQALAIVNGNLIGNDVFFLRPLLPYLLAPFYAVFGPGFLPFQLFQILVSCLSCLLLWDITRRIFNRLAAAFAAFSFAATGILVFYTGTLLYVEITIFLSLLLLWILLIAGDRPWLYLAAGITLGLLTICRPEALLLLPAAIFWYCRTKPPHALRNSLLLSVAALLIILSTPIRNYLVARDPVIFTAHSGINFYYGNNPDADGTWQPAGPLDRAIGFSHDRLKLTSRIVDGETLSWSRASAYWLRQGLNFALSHPLRYLRLLGRKFLLHWQNYEIPNNYYPETARAFSLPLRLSVLNFGFTAAFGILGMVWAWPVRGRAFLLYLMVALFLLSSLIFYVLSRLRAPAIPFLLAFAGFALSELWSALHRKEYRRASAGIAIAVLLYAGSSLIPVDRRTYSSQAWTQLGNGWLENRQPALAREALNRALLADSTNVSARYSLIELLCASGRKQEAAAELRRLARDAAGSPAGNTLVQLASARVAIAWRDFPVAAATYQTILAQDPANTTAWQMLGLVYVSTGDYDLAVSALSRAVELNPADSASRSLLQQIRLHRLQ